MIASWGFELQTADTHVSFGCCLFGLAQRRQHHHKDSFLLIFRPTEVAAHIFLIALFSTNEASMREVICQFFFIAERQAEERT
jgi:hypothetical protein